MVRRLGRTADARWEALGARGISGYESAVGVGTDYWAEERWKDEPRRESLATRLEHDHRLPSRIAYWLLIKGWMAVFIVAGLMASGLIAGLLGRR